MELAASLSQIVQNAAIATAVIIGGIWALYRYRRLREEKLSIECQVNATHSAKPISGVFIVSLLFRMKNSGARALKLAPDGIKPYDKPIQTRGEGMPWEKVAYRNCELMVWKLDVSAKTGDSLLSILNTNSASRIYLSDEPINLLAESRINPATFWFEPGEVVQSVVSLCLSPGYYVGQVVTLFNMRPIIRPSQKTRYTFDVFTFTFEVPSVADPVTSEMPSNVKTA